METSKTLRRPAQSRIRIAAEKGGKGKSAARAPSKPAGQPKEALELKPSLTNVQRLDPFFAPKCVAVLGATEKPGSVGRTLLWNIMTNTFGGTVYPINPKRPSVLGIKAYPSIKDVPEQVDLAVVVTPAETVLGVIEECGRAGVHHAVIISAGFKEIGKAGLAMEKKLLDTARAYGMRIVGPNCLGVMSPLSGLNATFAGDMARPGSVGFISQSGALCTSILDWSIKRHVGFSAFISVGSMLDVNWGDLIVHLGDDPKTRSILIYMESIGDAGAFLSAAREVALTKPIIVIKAGKTDAAVQAASTHTGGLAGSDAVLNAAFRRCGVLRVDSIEDLFLMADVVDKQPRPKGPNLTIVTNAGGPGVLATDTLIENGGQLTKLAPETLRELDGILPSHWSHGNPIDILGDASAERYGQALEIALRDPGSHGVLLVLSPQAMTDAAKVAECVAEKVKGIDKPVLASWMGEGAVAKGVEILNHANIPTFAYPDAAVQMFNYLWRYNYNIRGLYETPTLPQGALNQETAAEKVAAMLAKIREAKRELLTEFEAKKVLECYGIPTVETRLAATEAQAVKWARKIGFPVVLKLNSHTLTHKTDVKGVQLNLNSPAQVKAAFQKIQSAVEAVDRDAFQGVTVQSMRKEEGYELIVGSSLDAQFGPVLLFGLGGQLVEVFRDRALGLPPLNSTLARRMMEQTKIYQALKGVRGRKAVDMANLEHILVRFSQLVAEQPWIKEVDINPLLATPEGCWALDARIVQHKISTAPQKLPQLAIRPYPAHYTWHEKVDNNRVTIRPIRPEDEPLLVDFHHTLSERTIYHRYFSALKLSQRINHERLAQICFTDYNRAMVLVATRRKNGGHEVVGVGRLNKHRYLDSAEFAILIGDSYQKKGLGTKLLQKLLGIAKKEGISRVVADILPQNEGMIRVCRRLGFEIKHLPDAQIMKAVISC